MRHRSAPLLLVLATLALPTRGSATSDGDMVAPVIDGEIVESESAPKPCGEGTKVACGKTTTQTCTSWKLTTVSGGLTISPTGGGGTWTTEYTCASWKTVEMTLYKNP